MHALFLSAVHQCDSGCPQAAATSPPRNTNIPVEMKRRLHAKDSGAARGQQQQEQNDADAVMEQDPAGISNQEPLDSDHELGSSDADAAGDVGPDADADADMDGDVDADADADGDGDIEEDEDLDAGADSEPSSSGRGGSSASDAEGDVSSGGSGSEDEQGGRGSKTHAGFLSGGKAASFSKAFAKIMGQPIAAAPGTTPTGEEAGPGPASLAAAAAQALGSHQGDVGDVILVESASLAKRKAEVALESAARKEAKRHRLELRTRGHQAVPRKGEDPAHDAREKQLQRLATKGVVLLFNAINKAQKAAADAEAARRKGPKISKVGLLAELKAGQKALLGGPSTLPGAMGLVPQKQQQAERQQQRGKEADSEEEEGAGWEVLRAGIPGLTSGTKMKDWDKQMEVEEEAVAEQVAGSEEEEEEDGW